MTKVLISILLFTFAAFADDCETYGRKALACHEAGQLASSYNETGENCGIQQNFWNIEGSKSSTFSSNTVTVDIDEQLTTTVCTAKFQDKDIQGLEKRCFMSMTLRFTDEDAEVDVSRLTCI
jgi:hypothetical protein